MEPIVSYKGEKMCNRTAWIVGMITISLFFTFAGTSAAERFTDNGDGTVTDHLMGTIRGILIGRAQSVGSSTLSLIAYLLR
jgi:membrane protease YdiL (CAAX protease family)